MPASPIAKRAGLLASGCSRTNDDAIRILETLEEASEKQVFDGVPWVTATLKKGVPARPAWVSRRDQQAQRNAETMALLNSLGT
jgi:hypothetical protein